MQRPDIRRTACVGATVMLRVGETSPSTGQIEVGVDDGTWVMVGTSDL